MFEDNKKDIHLREINYKSIFLKSDIVVLILGGGKAAEIKLKSFEKQGIIPDIYSKEIESEYLRNKIESKAIKRLSFNSKIEDLIDKYHIINILTDDERFNQSIKSLCEEKKKLYLFGEDYSKGNLIIPIQKDTKSLSFSLRSKGVSPISSRYISKKIEDMLSEYDEFINYITRIRRSLIEKNIDESIKYEIMNFMNSDDFFFIYKKNKADIILKTFYGGDFFEDDSGD